MAGVFFVLIVEDLKTALNTITLKSTDFEFSFRDKWFLKEEMADEIETTSRLCFTLCLREFIYAVFKNKHIDEESLKEMTTSLDRQCTWRTVGFLLYATGCVDGKAKLLHLAGRRKRPRNALQVFIEAEENLWKR